MTARLRRKKLIEPRLQMRFAALFLGTAAAAALVEALVIAYTLHGAAGELPSDGVLLMEKLPGIMRSTFLLTLGLVTPLTFALGVLSVFKIVGPLYRFRTYLRGVADGTELEPCRIRQGDELQDFCELLNDVTAPLRAQARADRQASAPAAERRAA